jgi:hypothetical protein
MLSQTEIARDEAYVFREDYYHLKALSFLMNEKIPRCDAIISFIKKYNISVNVQLPIRNIKGTYVPIIYKCMLDNRLQKVTKYLFKNGANINQLPDSDKVTELVFVCSRYYLNFLKNNGASLQLSLEETIQQIRHRLLQGDIKRIYDLEYLGILKTNVILQALKEEIMSDLLVNLLNKVAVICNTTNEKQEVDTLLMSYKNTVKFLLNNGHDITNTQMQSVVNMYLVSIAKTIKEHYPNRNWSFVCLVKHKDMNRLKTAYMRQLFNDYNESQLIELFNSNSSNSESEDSTCMHLTNQD